MNGREPMKWRKHLILCGFGLRETADLKSEIHRFDINDTDVLIDEMRMKIDNTPPGTSGFFVIKLVNNDAIFSLPNYRIYNETDLSAFERDIAVKKHLYHEVWYCETRNNKAGLNLAGRVLFTYAINGYEQLIEQIWNRSPRLIDGFSSKSDFIFARAERPSWGYRHNISVLHVPPGCETSEDEIMRHFSYAARKIEAEREKTEVFEEYMRSFGFQSFSLEYKIDNGNFKFIDWDSPNDRLVLNRK